MTFLSQCELEYRESKDIMEKMAAELKQGGMKKLGIFNVDMVMCKCGRYRNPYGACICENEEHSSGVRLL